MMLESKVRRRSNFLYIRVAIEAIYYNCERGRLSTSQFS